MSRDAIFGKIRSSLGVKAGDPAREATVKTRIAGHARQLRPQRVSTDKTQAELTALFGSYLKTASATVVEVADASQVPSAVAAFLRGANLPLRIRQGSDEYLGNLPWSNAPGLTRDTGRAEPEDEASLSHAAAGVAETGTLVLASGPDNPVTLSFLPETHIVVVAEADIVGGYEDALERIRQRYGEGQMPRTVNMISGPSRTGDIGGRLVLGAHGPRRMCVIVVRSKAAVTG